MTGQRTYSYFFRWLRVLPSGMFLMAGLITAICILPFFAIIWVALTSDVTTIGNLAQTVLLGYVGNTIALVALVALGCALLGTGAAWLVVSCDFPARKLFEILLVVPLAFPAYVLAYAYTHLLDHPGIVQTALRDVMGWGPRDYWFPEIRSLGGAALMLTLVLYPYVYLLARTAFGAQSAAVSLAARTLGSSHRAAFFKISLPMARPAIASGVLLVMMETIADFGTVAHFGVPTFATGIYTTWFTLADRGAAAQLALGLLAFALLLALLERGQRGGARYAAGQQTRVERLMLSGWRAAGAMTLCAVPIVFGVVVPTIALFVMAIGSEQDLTSPRYVDFIGNSLTLAGVAAFVTVGAAITLGSLQRLRPGRIANAAVHIARLGYAVPGGVIAVGLFVPFAGLDNVFNGWMQRNYGISTGLLITGSIWLLIAAYMVRFLAAALGAYETGAAGISQNLDAVSRVLGQSGWAIVRRVHVPLMTPAILTAGLIVFVDVMKELPATLIMRPFNFDTLAVQAYRLASDERLQDAAVPSLLIAAIGLMPVIILCRKVRRTPHVKPRSIPSNA
jgi:iron(III) transport system permease protein